MLKGRGLLFLGLFLFYSQELSIRVVCIIIGLNQNYRKLTNIIIISHILGEEGLRLKYSIAFISPYKKLADLFAELANEVGKKIEIEIGDLEIGARKALELEAKGCDVVISRGGTSIAIKKEVTDLPVVDVPVSGFDLIRVLYYVRREADKIALVGFEPFTHGIEGLGEIMGINLKVFTLKEEWYEDTAKIKSVLQGVKAEGYNFVVGDNISVRMAKELGLETHLIKSGKESLHRALIEAENIARTRRREMEKTNRIKSIIDSAHEGIISINKDGRIDIFNPRAEILFNKKADKVIGREINDVLPELKLTKMIKMVDKPREEIWTVGKKKIAANVTPIRVAEEHIGVVATCQEVSGVQKMEQKIRKELYLKGYVAENTFDNIIGQTETIKETIIEAQDYARIDSPLLIFGETGTGKELFAQAVHNASFRHNKPFVAFNCAAIPENLLESELFGYVAGAFTGAAKGKAGLFEQAHEGTIFLDEIGEISLDIQVRLLRVLQERKVRRIGDDKITPVDVRIIVATNKDLYQLVEKGDFRKDLFYRINVLNLNIPPLRQRRNDIPLLVDYFIAEFNSRLKRVIKNPGPEIMKILSNYDWPGNVRQLENAVERLVVRAKGKEIPRRLVKETISSLEGSPTKGIKADGKLNGKNKISLSLGKPLSEMEKEIIDQVVRAEGGNKSAAAKRLGIGRTTLWRKLDG